MGTRQPDASALAPCCRPSLTPSDANLNSTGVLLLSFTLLIVLYLMSNANHEFDVRKRESIIFPSYPTVHIQEGPYPNVHTE